MRILCCNPNGGAFMHITTAWGNAFKSLGHDFMKWDGKEPSLRAFKPDIYLGCSGHKQSFPTWARQEFGTKVGIHVNPYFDGKLKKYHGVDVNEPKAAVQWTVNQQPDFVYCYADEVNIEQYYCNYNKKHGIKTIPMPTGGDTIWYHPSDPDSRFTCEVGFVGGYWDYKKHNLDKFIIPILGHFDVKIWGWGGWKVPQYKGKIADGDIRKVFSSAEVCPAVCEPHTTEVGFDVPERIFKIPLGGGLVISDPFESIGRYFKKGVVPVAQNWSEMRDLIKHYIDNPEEAETKKREQRLAVLKDHTYFSRIKQFFIAAGRQDEADKAQERVNQLVEVA